MAGNGMLEAVKIDGRKLFVKTGGNHGKFVKAGGNHGKKQLEKTCGEKIVENHMLLGRGEREMYSIHKNPIGIYEKALPKAFTWEEKFRAAKRAGFDYMELSVDESDERLARLDWSDEEIETLRTVMRFTGISFPTMCLSGHRKYPFGSKDPAVRKRAMEIMEKAIRLSVKLGIRCIQLAAYDVYYEESDEETKAFFLAGMREAVAMASRAGVILALEIMDTKFVGTIVRALHYLREIPSPYFKIYPDMGNLSNFSNDVTAEFEIGLAETVAIHVKETKPGVFKEVPFGEGEVKFAEIFAKLKELNYQGMFLVEMWADNHACQTVEEAAAVIGSAYRFVTGKMKEAGMEV